MQRVLLELLESNIFIIAFVTFPVTVPIKFQILFILNILPSFFNQSMFLKHIF